MYQAIDVPTETFKLETSQTDVDAGAVGSLISPTSPRYTYYHYPESEALIFIYTCPSTSAIKERMLYASSRKFAISLAETEGLNIHKKVMLPHIVLLKIASFFSFFSLV